MLFSQVLGFQDGTSHANYQIGLSLLSRPNSHQEIAEVMSYCCLDKANKHITPEP